MVEPAGHPKEEDKSKIRLEGARYIHERIVKNAKERDGAFDEKEEGSMSKQSCFPEEKLRQAFDLVMSLLSIDTGNDSYHFEISDICVSFWCFEDRRISKHCVVCHWEAGRLDELIDMIEDELNAKRSGRNDQTCCRD